MRVLALGLRESENRRVADLLLVDNDPRLAELVAFFLRRSGHDVRLAASFALARAELGRSPPDLMLSDLDLGEESGLVELPRLAADGLLPPTLVVSGYVDRASQVELERLPQIIGTLGKPFDLDLLLARVTAGLAQRPVHDPESADEGWVELGSGTEDA